MANKKSQCTKNNHEHEKKNFFFLTDAQRGQKVIQKTQKKNKKINQKQVLSNVCFECGLVWVKTQKKQLSVLNNYQK